MSVSAGSMTSGLVGEMDFQVLPSISPFSTLVITVATMLVPTHIYWRYTCMLCVCTAGVLQPALFKLWLKPSTPLDFIKTLILCAFSSFLFGWHVHEKAIMMITLPAWWGIRHAVLKSTLLYYVSIVYTRVFFAVFWLWKRCSLPVSLFCSQQLGMYHSSLYCTSQQVRAWMDNSINNQGCCFGCSLGYPSSLVPQLAVSMSCGLPSGMWGPLHTNQIKVQQVHLL